MSSLNQHNPLVWILAVIFLALLFIPLVIFIAPFANIRLYDLTDPGYRQFSSPVTPLIVCDNVTAPFVNDTARAYGARYSQKVNVIVVSEPGVVPIAVNRSRADLGFLVTPPADDGTLSNVTATAIAYRGVARTPFYLISPKIPGEWQQQFINFTKGKECREIMASHGLVPAE